jgi:hypothetical protein
MPASCISQAHMAIKFKSESEKNEIVTYSKVANAERAASCYTFVAVKNTPE